MIKSVGLARTLILKPQIILYDEPKTGLDPNTSKEISNLILEIQKKYNAASNIITHDVECARLTAYRMMIIKDGASVAEGTFDTLSASQDTWVHSFLE
jgi:phospholipid/cholesterol/gamma-HCH transport system ATP-binding protein